jgi:hypothetical protein
MASKTIVILVTTGPEYRVQTVDTPEFLYNGINANTNKWIPNSNYIHEQFDGELAFSYEGPALRLARKQAEGLDLEGGIQIIDIWSDMLYTDL